MHTRGSEHTHTGAVVGGPLDPISLCSEDSSSTTHQPETDDWWEPFGDLLGGKKEGILRAGVQNFGGMASKPNQPEDESLRRWITEKQFEV